jgi:hypothetical protein
MKLTCENSSVAPSNSAANNNPLGSFAIHLEPESTDDRS